MGGNWVEREKENIIEMGKALACLWKKRYLKNENMKSILREYFLLSLERINYCNCCNYCNWKRLRIDVIVGKRIRKWDEFIII